MVLSRVIGRSVVLSLCVMAAACGSEPAAPAPTVVGGGVAVDETTAGALAGQAIFSGTPPAPEMLHMGTDAACTVVGGADQLNDAVLVDASGGLANAFVYVKDGLDPKYAFAVPQTPVVLDQVGCRYHPHVLGIRVGQPLEVLNSDDTLHNVHALPVDNVEFNEGQPLKGLSMTHLFTTPEVAVRFKCDVHSWMAAYVGVVAHPYFAVTASDGSFSIPGLPPGTYTIEAWHERFGRLTEQVTIGDRETATLTFTFSAN
jgi:plastocyanin